MTHIADDRPKPRFKVANEWQTIETLTEQRLSIARFGDGEFNIAIGRNAKSQRGDEALAARLRGILKTNSKSCLVGIPNMYAGNTALPGTKAHMFWGNMAQRRHYDALLSPKKQYYSSFITRPDNAHAINCPEYWDAVKRLWEGRNVVTVTGEGQTVSKDPSLLANANIIGRIEGPSVNAWANYPVTIMRCAQYPPGTLFLLCLGATATVLAYDLSESGYQALDLGHLGRFYAKQPSTNV